LLESGLKVKENELLKKNFSDTGCLGSGTIHPPVSMVDFYSVQDTRVGDHSRCRSRVGIQHRVTKEDAMKWFQVKYEGLILNKSQNIT
ncbi:60S ribosomal protein L11A, partial [Turnera subulata]